MTLAVRLIYMRRRALFVAVLLLVAACGSDAGVTSTSGPTTTNIETTTTSMPPVVTTEVPGTTTTEATTTTTSPGTSTTTLAGEPIDLGPVRGDVLMVIGVRHDDVLNLRAGPGVASPIVARVPPLSAGLVAEGKTRSMPGSFWIEVEYEGAQGWVNMSYVGYEGFVDDQTSTVVAELGEIPVEPTMTGLGELVASTFASTEPASDIVQVAPVTIGDLAEVTYDVIGLGDDAVRGLRLHIFAEKVDDGFTLKSAEVTSICSRGVDTDDLCV